VLFLLSLRQVVVFEYECGILYQRGHFAGVLEPGSYWVHPRLSTIAKVDIRPTYISVPSQELSTSDGATIKITVAAKYQITDPNIAINQVAGLSGSRLHPPPAIPPRNCGGRDGRVHAQQSSWLSAWTGHPGRPQEGRRSRCRTGSVG